MPESLSQTTASPKSESQQDFDTEMDFAHQHVQGQKHITDFPYHEDYRTTIAQEAPLFSPNGKSLFIGGGPVPLTPMMLSSNHGIHPDIMEYNPQAAEIGSRVLQVNKQGHMPYIVHDATSFPHYGNYKNIMLALEAGDNEARKEAILRNIHSQMKPDASLLVRASNVQGTDGISYPTLPKAVHDLFDVQGKVDTFGGYSSTYQLSPKTKMVKSERRSIFTLISGVSHPHAYEWHDGHTIHHKVITKSDEPDSGKSFQHVANEQAAIVGVPTYIEYAKHYGTINKALHREGSVYNYRGLSDKINDLIKQHGYQVYYAGGKYGKPDLATKNYDTSHLMIYDPTPDSGGDQGDFEQTDNWRKVHELAHALTREQVNNTRIPSFGDATYGERPRMGRLGKQRTLRDAMRAIHWEALAVQKQRELSEQLGLKISQEDFNREWNTNQHDATHRAVTGRFSEPRKEGFHPSTTPVPIEFSLGLARKAAEQMGMKGLDELKGMVKSELLVKTERLLTQLRKATSTRTGHITFPQLGATTHEKPMIIKPSQVAGKMRMASVGDVSSLTPWGKKKEIKNIRQEASDIQRDAEEDVQDGHVMGMMSSAPWIPHNTIINRIRQMMGKPTTGGSRSTGFVTGPSSIGSVESGKRLNAVEAHEEQHSVGGRLHYIHPAASKAAFDRVGWMAVSQDQDHPNHYPMVIDAINRYVENVGLDPRVSRYEEFFAHGQQYLMDPDKRDFFHNQVELYNGGRKMSIIDKRNAFKTIERIMNLGKRHAANMTQDDLVEQLRSMGHKI